MLQNVASRQRTQQLCMKKALRETQTLRAGCSKAEPNFFVLLQTPFPGAQDGQNLISWRWPLPLPTDPVWWRSMHAISSYRGNRPTYKQTNPKRGPITIHCATASTQCNINAYIHNQLLFSWPSFNHMLGWKPLGCAEIAKNAIPNNQQWKSTECTAT